MDRVMTRLPGLIFDVLTLLEVSQSPDVPDGGSLQRCPCHNCREMSTDLEGLCYCSAPENCIMAYMQYYIFDEGVLRLARAAWNDVFAIDDDQEPGVEQRQYSMRERQFVLWQHDHWVKATELSFQAAVFGKLGIHFLYGSICWIQGAPPDVNM